MGYTTREIDGERRLKDGAGKQLKIRAQAIKKVRGYKGGIFRWT
jgi:hypothetical protein